MPLPIETGPDETRAHPHHTGRSRLDLVLAVAAIFISLVSLFVAVEHGRIEQRLLAASTWPFLQLQINGDGSDISVSIVNAGVGPAKLASIEAFTDGGPVKDMDALAQTCCERPAAALGDRLVGSELANAVLRPGQVVTLLRFRDAAGDAALDRRMQTTLRHLSWQACYCSVFDECWVSNLVELRPRPVAACPASRASFNANYFR